MYIIYFLLFSEKPKIVDLKTSSDTSIDVGEELILTCGAIGRPEPQIKWTRMAGADLPNGGKELWVNFIFLLLILGNLQLND